LFGEFGPSGSGAGSELFAQVTRFSLLGGDFVSESKSLSPVHGELLIIITLRACCG